MVKGCADCENKNEFCNKHQQNEKEVYESSRFAGRHGTQEFRLALHDARNKDME
jgi:hypothetical protein